MKLSIKAGATSQSVNVFIQNSSSTTGAGLTGLAYNSSGLTAYYSFAGASATSTQITLATLATVTTAWTSGGFIQIDATNMPGVYRLDLPNAVIASGNGRSVIVYLQGATNMAPLVLEIELTGWDNQDAVHGGMSALPNTACTTNASLITSGTGTDQLEVASGRVDLGKILGTASAGAAGYVAPDWSAIHAPTTTVDLSGTTIKNLDNNPPGYPTNFSSLVINSDGTVQSDLEKIADVALGTHAAGMVPADLRDIAGSAVNTSSAQLGVNVVNYAGVAAAVDANNFPKVDVEDVGGVALATHAAGMVPADLRDIAGSAVSTSTAQLGVNVVNIAGQAAALDGNNLLKVDVEDINGSAAAAQNVSKANQAIGRGTCTTGGTTTSIPTSAWSLGGAGVVAGQFQGCTMIFDANTATASLQGQRTNITTNTSGATPTFTVTALTTAPSSSDTFGIY